jgi:hypothetical protein
MPDEPYVDPGTADTAAEITAMAASYEAMRSLPSDAQWRAVRWLAGQLGVTLDGSAR